MLKKILISLLLISPQLYASERPTRIAFVGDVMLGSNYKNGSYPEDLKTPIISAAPWLRFADLSFGNLEGTITDYQNSGKNCERCYSFRMPKTAAKALSDVGFDVMSSANNHANDFGQYGINDTKAELLKNGILSTGPKNSQPSIIIKNNKKFGIVAFAPNNGMNDPRDLRSASLMVQDLKRKVDFVIISVHAGAEGVNAENVYNKNEIYLGENRGNVYAFSRVVIDSGADIVIGHGPHVPRALDFYKGKLIAYSLGNFSTYGGFSLNGSLSLAPLLWVEVNKDNTIKCLRIGSFKQRKPGITELDNNESAYNKILLLTKQNNIESYRKVNNFISAECSSPEN